MISAPKPIDVYIGRRLAKARTLCGMTQTDLGNRVGLSFQQIQKYEKGANRISAGLLFELARILGEKIDYFFRGYESTVLSTDNDRFERGSIRVARKFSRIRDARVQKAIECLLDELAPSQEHGPGSDDPSPN
ncbi:MAG: helix-turn-helix transcriptional regulator [Pseudomonadota bacterium]